MTKVLNFDELLSEPAYTVIIKGVEHHMQTPTLEDFIANLKDMEALAAAPNMLAEVEATARMIARAFPTLTEADVRQWPVPAIERLFATIRGFDGDTTVTEASAEGNAAAES